MLYNFLNPFYVVIMSFFIPLLMMLFCGNKFIALMHQWQHEGQPIRECGPQSHLQTKKGTPTMGGILILASILLTLLFLTDLRSTDIWVCMAVIVVFGLTGFIDDYIKVKKHTANALTAKGKLIIQFSVALMVGLYASYRYDDALSTSILLPFLGVINIHYLYVPLVMLVITGTSNAVNLSDGLDGLASGLLIPTFLIIAVWAMLFGYFALDDAFAICLVCVATIGACLGFLWFNGSPAQIFMGDTGSLALGALLGTLAVLTKLEIFLPIFGLVFVIEALSVIIQVFWYKRTHRRIFLMAPIHHHFEQAGWKETTVVMRFWIVGWIAAVLSVVAIFLTIGD